MNKTIIKAIVTSIVAMAVISSLLGYAALLVGYSFWAAFCAGIALQLILGALWNTYIENKSTLQIESIKATNRLANSVQTVELACAYCATKNITEIFAARENTFDCVNCNSTNKVQVSISTVRVTEPIVKDKVLSEVFKKMQEVPEAKNVDSINEDKIEITGGKNG